MQNIFTILLTMCNSYLFAVEANKNFVIILISIEIRMNIVKTMLFINHGLLLSY